MILRDLFEEKNTHVTFCFGRMNPPTIGHKQLLDTVASVGGNFSIFVSQTQDKKKNPLDYQTKIKFMKAMFPEYSKNIVNDANLNTIGKVASFLYDQGYRNATFVAGSDRLEDMKNLLTTYNGVEGKAHGYYDFETLDFKSSGDREDGAEGVAGISASNARAAAANNDLEDFKKSTGAGKFADALFKAVREGMGIKEDAAGVGIVNKQNSTKDVGPGTLRKNLKAFKLTNEAPIELDPTDPMDPMIHSHDKANPGKLKYRMMRAAAQIKDLASRVDKASPSEWQTMTRQFEELKMNMEQIRHALEELAKIRKKGGIRSRGIDPMIDSIQEANYGRYWCSTDKKWKYRKGPKQKRSS
mgnify:CR=1 FL=1